MAVQIGIYLVPEAAVLCSIIDSTEVVSLDQIILLLPGASGTTPSWT
jgi:hypothetical protein